MARTVTVPSMYERHREWALDLAREHDDSDEGHLVALVVLWQCCREYPRAGFRKAVEPHIVEALQRQEVET